VFFCAAAGPYGVGATLLSRGSEEIPTKLTERPLRVERARENDFL
jgi:hypothetical protein